MADRVTPTSPLDIWTFIGDEMAQSDHEKEMSSDMGGMHHGDSDAITVGPGKTGTLTHTFKAGVAMLTGCHQPGTTPPA